MMDDKEGIKEEILKHPSTHYITAYLPILKVYACIGNSNSFVQYKEELLTFTNAGGIGILLGLEKNPIARYDLEFTSIITPDETFLTMIRDKFGGIPNVLNTVCSAEKLSKMLLYVENPSINQNMVCKIIEEKLFHKIRSAVNESNIPITAYWQKRSQNENFGWSNQAMADLLGFSLIDFMKLVSANPQFTYLIYQPFSPRRLA